MTSLLNALNDAQREAVTAPGGPSLVIAGAGSGKTRVLTYHIAWLLSQGITSGQILALTFTNKAAKEMKERIASLVGEKECRHLWMGTFHSVFARILRIEGNVLGFTSSFTIYDTQDAKNLMFRLLVIYFVRSFGIEAKITLQSDNGEEFAGKSVDKLEYLNKKVFAPLLAELLHIPKGKKEYQAFGERSHQTDDNEFCVPQLERCGDLKEFYFRALSWQFMYNTLRHHSTLGMTPYRKLRMEQKLSQPVALFPVIQLEKLTELYPKLFPQTGYHVSAKDRESLVALGGGGSGLAGFAG